MSMKMLVTLRTDQRLSMNLQLRQAITLLQYNTIELTQRIQQTLDTNPFLEVDDYEASMSMDEDQVETYKSYSAQVSRPVNTSYRTESDNALENYAVPISLRNFLLEQTLLSQFTAEEHEIAEAWIDSVDDDGYVTVTAEVMQMLFPTAALATIDAVLQQLQTYEPSGVCARNLRECFLIQLQDATERSDVWHIARRIVADYLAHLASHNPKAIIKKMHVSEAHFTAAIRLIRHLNPKPGLQFTDDRDQLIDPELFVKKMKNEWIVCLKDSLLTNIKINKQYHDLIKSNQHKSAFDAIRKELDEARLLLKGLAKRNQTLLAVGRYIAEVQRDFLEMGPLQMKPMNIADVATALGVHESTVSRITTGKYIATPKGVYELKYFFPSYVTTDQGGSCSAVTVKALMQQVFDTETSGTILSDADIVTRLKSQGVCLSRRTVAKYREAMKILPSYLRQKQHELA